MWSLRRRRNRLQITEITRPAECRLSRAERLCRRRLAEKVAEVEWRQFAGSDAAGRTRANRRGAPLKWQRRLWAAALLVAVVFGTVERGEVEAMVRDGSRASAYWLASVERPALHALQALEQSD